MRKWKRTSQTHTDNETIRRKPHDAFSFFGGAGFGFALLAMKVIAFDCFGTVFDASSVPASELRDYVNQCRQEYWLPLELPPSWYGLPAHSDSAEGIARLRKKYRVVTCSNLPLRLLWRLSQEAGIKWDAIVPLEAGFAYKPNPQAYRVVCDVLQVEPTDVMVVTAHADGPDINGAPEAGMKVKLIRSAGSPESIIGLAKLLNC